MRAISITLFIVAVGLSSQAQTRTIYYTSKWEITPKEQASYYRICQIEFGLNKYFYTGSVEDYTMDGKLVMKGAYDEHGLKTGEFVLYYPNGQIQALGNFKINFRERTWKYFFENGSLEREVKFPVQERFTPLQYDFEPISVYDSAGIQLIKNGTGQWHYEYEWAGVDGRYVVDGKFEKGKKVDEWTCSLNGNILYSEIYKNDNFKEGYLNNEGKREKLTEPIDNKFMLPYKFEVTENFVYLKGTTQDLYPFLGFLPLKSSSSEVESKIATDTIPDNEKIFFAVEQQAVFPGGMAAMGKFIQKNQKYPALARRMGIEGNVYVIFLVEKDGSVSNVKIQRGINADLDKEAIRIVSMFPKWTPGMQNGRPVKSQFIMPIPFKLDF